MVTGWPTTPPRCPTRAATCCSAARASGVPGPAGCCAAAARSRCPGADASRWPSPTPTGLALPFAAGAYDGLLKALVNAHKEHGVLALAAPLGRVLGDVVHDLLGALDAGREAGTVLLVPVPSRGAVVRRRGHDPLLRVTRAAAVRLRRTGVDARVRRLLVPAGRVRDQAAPRRGAAGRQPGRVDALPPAAGDGPGRRGRRGRRRADHRVDGARGPARAGGGRPGRRRGRHRRGHPAPTPRPIRGLSTVLGARALTSLYGVRPGPWLRRRSPVRGRCRSSDRMPDTPGDLSASRCQSQAKRST